MSPAKKSSAARGATLHVKTRTPLLLPLQAFLREINDLRAEHGTGKTHQRPLTLTQILSGTRICENRTAEHAMVTLRVTYTDADDMPTGREFPNFGLDVRSESHLREVPEALELSVDVLITAGKAKWQPQELHELAEALRAPDARVGVVYTASESVDGAGHSAYPDVVLEQGASAHRDGVPVAAFEVSLA